MVGCCPITFWWKIYWWIDWFYIANQLRWKLLAGKTLKDWLWSAKSSKVFYQAFCHMIFRTVWLLKTAIVACLWVVNQMKCSLYFLGNQVSKCIPTRTDQWWSVMDNYQYRCVCMCACMGVRLLVCLCVWIYLFISVCLIVQIYICDCLSVSVYVGLFMYVILNVSVCLSLYYCVCSIRV